MNNIIPHKWEVKKFDEIFDVVTDYVANGSFASLRENVSYKDDEDYAILVRLQDYSNKFQKNFVYVDEHAYNFLSKSKLNPNDLVICNVGAAGIIFKVPDLKKPMTLGPNSILVRTNESSDYMYYYIQSSIGQQKLKDITTTTAQPKFNKTDFKSIKCILPPLKEQQKIAEILSSVDAAIEKTEQVIAKTERLKKGLMQQLLTKGIGHTEFKQTEIGEIPIEWGVKSLQQLSSFMSNGFVGVASPFYTEDCNGVNYLMSNNVRANKFDLTKLVKITPEFHQKQCKTILKKGDMLTVQSGHIGTSCIVNEDFDGANCHALIITRFEESVNPTYVSYYLNSTIGYNNLKKIFVGSTIKHINVKDFKGFKVPVPSFKEQTEIVSILKNIDEKISKEEEELFLLHEIKQGLMQQLLTGQVRVKID